MNNQLGRFKLVSQPSMTGVFDVARRVSNAFLHQPLIWPWHGPYDPCGRKKTTHTAERGVGGLEVRHTPETIDRQPRRTKACGWLAPAVKTTRLRDSSARVACQVVQFFLDFIFGFAIFALQQAFQLL